MGRRDWDPFLIFCRLSLSLSFFFFFYLFVFFSILFRLLYTDDREGQSIRLFRVPSDCLTKKKKKKKLKFSFPSVPRIDRCRSTLSSGNVLSFQIVLGTGKCVGDWRRRSHQLGLLVLLYLRATPSIVLKVGRAT